MFLHKLQETDCRELQYEPCCPIWKTSIKVGRVFMVASTDGFKSWMPPKVTGLGTPKMTAWLRDQERNFFALLLLVGSTCSGWEQTHVLFDLHFVYRDRSWAEASAFLWAGSNEDKWGKPAPFFPWGMKFSRLTKAGDTSMPLESHWAPFELWKFVTSNVAVFSA